MFLQFGEFLVGERECGGHADPPAFRVEFGSGAYSTRPGREHGAAVAAANPGRLPRTSAAEVRAR
jgi:hypothetical protein